MGQVLIRNVDDEVLEQLRQRAREHGLSLEAELRVVLEREAKPKTDEELKARLTALSQKHAGKKFADSVELLRKMRGHLDED